MSNNMRTPKEKEKIIKEYYSNNGVKQKYAKNITYQNLYYGIG